MIMQSDPDTSLGSSMYTHVTRFDDTSNACFSCVGDIYKCFQFWLHIISQTTAVTQAEVKRIMKLITAVLHSKLAWGVLVKWTLQWANRKLGFVLEMTFYFF